MSQTSSDALLFIDGQQCNALSGKTYTNYNPATEQAIGQVADAGPEDMERAIAAARRAFDETDWSTNPTFRHHCISQLHSALEKAKDTMRPLIGAETGAPLGICGMGGPQCDIPISFIPDTLQLLENFEWQRDIGESEFMNMRSQRIVHKEAIGVVACITPWNVPLQINLAKAIPALAAGCTVVLKAAPDTPLAAALLGELIEQHTDIPAGVFNIITASDPRQVGEQLVTDPRVDMISFTGSTATGKHIMAQASEQLKKVFLELGGKSANIILEDADLASALFTALQVCFHAGQGCAICTRLLIPRSRYDEAKVLLEQYFGFISYGDPDAEDQIMGSLISEQQRQKVLACIEKGVAEGASLLLGGGVPAHLEKGYYVEPTVFVDVTNDMAIAQEEIFGPVLAVIPFEDDDDAVRIANDSIYGLSGMVTSADQERALAVAKRIRTGTINVNGGNFYAGDAPFGGYKQSGIGREMGLEGFEEYLETKTVAIGVA